PARSRTPKRAADRIHDLVSRVHLAIGHVVGTARSGARLEDMHDCTGDVVLMNERPLAGAITDRNKASSSEGADEGSVISFQSRAVHRGKPQHRPLRGAIFAPSGRDDLFR